MEPKTENDGTNTKGRKNVCRREKERGREGENIPSCNRMTRVNRYEVSIIYPSSIGPFSLK